MRAPSTLLRPAAVGLALALSMLAACGDDSEAPAGPPGFDFGARETAQLGDGWTIAHCEGDAPIFCIADGDDIRGSLEILDHPVATYDAVAAVLEAGGSTAEALRAQATEFQETFEADRPLGCGPGYTVERYGPRAATVGGLPGVIYGFDASEDGRRVERALQFTAIDGDVLYILAISAVEPGTCLDNGESLDLTADELDELQPSLERLVATSRFP